MATGIEELAASDLDRIRREEIFRRAVQKELEKEADPKGILGKFWKALNSAFCIWFLSTIALGSIAWAYNQWKTASEKGVEQDRLLTSLYDEIHYRGFPYHQEIWRLKSLLETRVKEGKLTDLEIANTLARIYKDLDNPDTPAYPEFRGRGILSLIVQREQIDASIHKKYIFLKEKKRDYQSARHAVLGLRSIHGECVGMTDVPTLLAKVSQIDEIITGRLLQIVGGPEAPYE